MAGIRYFSNMIFLPGICLFIADFTLDLEQNFREFNEIALQQRNVCIERKIELKQKLNRIVQFHADAKELSSTFETFMKKVILMCLFTIYLDSLAIFPTQLLKLYLCIYFLRWFLCAIYYCKLMRYVWCDQQSPILFKHFSNISRCSKMEIIWIVQKLWAHFYWFLRYCIYSVTSATK